MFLEGELVLTPGVARPKLRRYLGRRHRGNDPCLQGRLPLVWVVVAPQAAELSTAAMDELLMLCRWHLGLKYKRDPRWEDILSEGYLGALAAIRRVQVTGACSLSTAATRGAAWGAMSYLRSAQNPERRFSRKGQPLPFVVSLTECEEDQGDEPEEWERDDLPTLPDFVPELVSRLDMAGAADDLLATRSLSPMERIILRRVVMHEEPAAGVAADLGLTPARLASLKHGALAKLKGERTDGQDDGPEGRSDRDDPGDAGRLCSGARSRRAVPG